MLKLPLIKYVITAAIRDRLIIGMCVLILCTIAMSIFMGSAAIIEQDQFMAVFSAGSIRILNVLGLVLFIVFFVRRSFESHDIEFMLSRPVGRIQLITSYAIGFSAIALILGALSGVCIIALSPHLYSDGHLLWMTSLIAENIIMACTALFFSMILTSAATGTFATLGFYVLARMMSQILGILDSSKYILYDDILGSIMQVISAVMPRLDLMAQTSWLVYGMPDDLNYAFVFAQGAAYSILIVSAGLIDMWRRQF